MKVVLPYTPRKQQAYVHDELSKYRYAVLCCHRRFGKTVLCINHLIKMAMTNRNHQPRYAYIAPTYSQAKKIAWDYLKHFTDKIPGTKYNETELRCDLVNGARITLLSSENPDSIRGSAWPEDPLRGRCHFQRNLPGPGCQSGADVFR